MEDEVTAPPLPESVQCPVCSKGFKPSKINAHLDRCLQDDVDRCPSTMDEGRPPLKKPRVTTASPPPVPVSTANGTPTRGLRGTSSTVFSLFQNKKQNVSVQGERSPSFSEKLQQPPPSSSSAVSKGVKRTAPGDIEPGQPDADPTIMPSPPSSQLTLVKTSTEAVPSRTFLTTDKPLAETLRPKTLEEYFGQNKVVGEHTLLRSLLESQDIPSLILWGPPGCGKTTLAHIIASKSKQKGTVRFVKLSATSASTSDVREVIKQAQNELRLCKRRTIMFIDEIHRFNKSQQDTFLPHVECGTVTLIGATTENPSFQVNSALLSRCRVLVLEKLSVEAMGSILQRAVVSLGVHVLGDGEQAGDLEEPPDDGAQPQVYIEQRALDTVAHLCDGDARAGLNGLQMALQARVGGAPSGRVVVQEKHVKEGLQRSHILYDKAGEEHFNCISALHKSMRGSHENASLYWLARMLEGGEDPLYVARRLVRFASEDVGLADPLALPQAVSAYQACHFIGMPECEVILAQCAVYLARAPKSVEVYKAYSNVKASLRTHKGPLPSVPLHLRNASTKLMRELGYAKGYKYNPAFSSPAEQEYLPEELRGVDFFTWTPSE
ncbi:ATPase WRNIP1 isoform X1 [Gadus morhua]|uniref:ATPase WRNIP1 isoform X1 n=1 Tax=Gadus morhua TaxID=8049 RepID=UPI0011B4E547|nr:ATPase WRNIP1 isoform X1 [Gadus morhua]